MKIDLSKIIKDSSPIKSKVVTNHLEKIQLRQHHICDLCFICDEDLVLAMQKMTTASINYILEQGQEVLKMRGDWFPTNPLVKEAVNEL